MVVVITSTGGVSKRVLHVRAPGRRRASSRGRPSTSTSAWSASASARGCCTRACSDPSLGRQRARRSSTRLAPAFTELAETAEDTLYVDGAARLLSEHRFQDLSADQRADDDARAPRRAARRAARRARPSATCSSASARENELPALQLARARRRRLRPARRASSGTVSVIGPVRMDYATAIGTVREAALPAVALRRRRLRGMTATDGDPPRDPYEVLGVARDADETDDQEGVPQARARAAPRRQPPRPRRRGEVQGGRRGLRDPLRRRAPRDLRPLRPRRACARGGYGPELRGLRLDLRPLRRVLRRRGGGASAAAAAAGRRQGGDVAVQRRDHARRRRRPAPTVELSFEAIDTLRALPRQRRRARHADRHLRALRRRRRAAGGQRARRSARSCARSRATSAAARARSPSSRASSCEGRGREVAPPHAARRRPGRDRRRPAHPPRPAAATPASAAARPATSTSSSASPTDERFLRDGDDLVTVLDVPAPLAALGATLQRPDARRRRRGRRSRPARSRAR